jgi:hypothetical protein
VPHHDKPQRGEVFETRGDFGGMAIPKSEIPESEIQIGALALGRLATRKAYIKELRVGNFSSRQPSGEKFERRFIGAMTVLALPTRDADTYKLCVRT